MVARSSPSMLLVINRASGSSLQTETGSESPTAEVQVAEELTLDGRAAILIDTPVSDGTLKSDTEILKMIMFFLVAT